MSAHSHHMSDLFIVNQGTSARGASRSDLISQACLSSSPRTTSRTMSGVRADVAAKMAFLLAWIPLQMVEQLAAFSQGCSCGRQLLKTRLSEALACLPLG